MTNKEFELQKACLLEGVRLGQLTQEEVDHVVDYVKSNNQCIGCKWNDGFPHIACEKCEVWQKFGY